jgi:hypothetical protein
MFRYIDDILSQNNSKVGDYVEGIYRIELELHDTHTQLGLLHTFAYTLRVKLFLIHVTPIVLLFWIVCYILMQSLQWEMEITSVVLNCSYLAFG